VELLDRSRYRMCEDSKLLEEAKYNPTAELAIVLGERLEEVYIDFDEELEAAKERAADFERDANRLDDELCELQHKIDVLELMLATRDETIEELKKKETDR
jgi:predicted  nucleic acid-binding Zn-ribbon protein